jgi:hypothetical protein
MYKVNATHTPAWQPAGYAVADCYDYATAEKIARMLSADDMGHYWVTTVTREPLTSFTGGQRDHTATGGQS